MLVSGQTFRKLILRNPPPLGSRIKNVKGKAMGKAIKGKLKKLTEAYKKLLTMWVHSRNVFIMVQSA